MEPLVNDANGKRRSQYAYKLDGRARRHEPARQVLSFHAQGAFRQREVSESHTIVVRHPIITHTNEKQERARATNAIAFTSNI